MHNTHADRALLLGFLGAKSVGPMARAPWGTEAPPSRRSQHNYRSLNSMHPYVQETLNSMYPYVQETLNSMYPYEPETLNSM